MHEPSHEQYDDWTDPEGKIWSAIALSDFEEYPIVHTKRAIFTLDPKTKTRSIVGEWLYPDVNLTKCTGTYISEGLIEYI